MGWRAFGEALVTLLVIMDPLGNAPVFVSLTSHLDPRESRRAALAAVGAAAGLVLGFALFGQLVLEYLNISVESLSIAGGLLLFLVALDMLRGTGSPREPTAGDNIALFPLATPLLAGPGAIASAMVLVRRYPSAGGRASVVAGIVVAVLVVGAALLVADRLSRLVSRSVVQFLTRVLGLLLSAIAVQLVVDGVQGLLDRA
jgi:multiple antibiotic resistance protein